ncbi:unnamed protein product [Heligmosomoides polygyrus]|uniref:Rtf2 domain-containing protein n=1 Tax=Heligmosomoides polygyrus TaxID=6339 RepID=A0A183GIL1_HELPZ|nr:unnamed protein product [Heligmosomoides polygyrus]
MGADGGTIPKRCELVQKKKKVEKLERSVKNASKWKNCQMSQQPLKKPIIACRYGRLYNKETVIEAILTKTIGNYAAASHIKGLKVSGRVFSGIIRVGGGVVDTIVLE